MLANLIYYYLLLAASVLRLPQWITLYKHVKYLNSLAMYSWFSLIILFFPLILLIRRNNNVITEETCPVSIVEGVDPLEYYNLPFEGWKPLRTKQIISMVIVPIFAFLGMLRRKTYDDSF